jgi:integral membrane protein
VLANVVGVGLVILVFVGLPLNRLADQPVVSAVVGPLHGFLYLIYLAFALDLARRARWSVRGTVLVFLAGTIPFMSFVADRIVTRRTRAGQQI